MQTAKTQVIIWFFLVILTTLIYKFISTEAAPTDVREATKSIVLEKLVIQKETLRRNDLLVFYGEISALSVALVCALMISYAYKKKLSIHVLELRSAKIPMREKDLPKALPVVYDLALAEKMEQNFPEKAFALYEKMAAIRIKELDALTVRGRLTTQIALPESTNINISAPAQTPTFQKLLESGEIAIGKPMILAVEAGGLIRGTWLDLFSCAVGGQSGSGKTGTLRSYVCQSVLQGFQVWIIDPHYPHPESLQASLWPFIEKDLVKVGLPVEVCKEVNQTIDRRLRTQEDSSTPAILVVDEVLDVMTNCPGAAQTIEKIGTQGRKCQVYGLFAGHSWLAAKTGGSSALRDNLTAKICHHMEKKQAKVLIDDNETAKQIQKLKTGEAFLKVIGKEPIAVKIPECVTADVIRVATLLKVANGQNVSSETFPPVDNDQKNQTPFQVSRGMFAQVSKNETPQSELCLKSETPLKTRETPDGTLILEYMLKHRKSREEIANILGVSVSMVKEVLAGRKKLTSERKERLEKK